MRAALVSASRSGVSGTVVEAGGCATEGAEVCAGGCTCATAVRAVGADEHPEITHRIAVAKVAAKLVFTGHPGVGGSGPIVGA